MPRAEAESGPQAHAITRWLGIDAPDHTPRTHSLDLDGPGWVLVCSDGLWNYCSEATDLAALVRARPAARTGSPDPLALAAALVDWANAQGGVDNITVALARIDPPSGTEPTARATAAAHQRQTERKAPTMATFSAEVYQNEFLPDGGSDVHAIVTVTCAGAGTAGSSGSGDAGEIVIVDTSGSMGADKIAAAQQAAAAALDEVHDGVWFAVIAGSHEARLAYPAGGLGMVADGRQHAGGREGRRSAGFEPDGRHRHGHLAAARDRGLRLGAGPGAEARDPADRRHQPARDARAARPRRSRRRGASSSATAAVSAPTGRSPRYAGSPPRCSAPST